MVTTASGADSRIAPLWRLAAAASAAALARSIAIAPRLSTPSVVVDRNTWSGSHPVARRTRKNGPSPRAVDEMANAQVTNDAVAAPREPKRIAAHRNSGVTMNGHSNAP